MLINFNSFSAHASADNNQLLAVGAPSSKNHDDELNASHPLSSSLSCNLQKNFNQKTLKCNFCNKSFARKSSLKGHITLIHTGEEGTLSSKTYCGKSSRSKNDSNNDIRIHREEGSSPTKNSRKIVCEKRRSKNHTRIHTAKEAQLQSGNSKCNFCEKSFSRKSSLKGHITLMHSEEEILDSGKSSLPKNSLKSNITTHKKGKSSPIKSSSEIFGKKSRLKDNVRINPEETQFKGENLKCDYCDKKFSRKSSLIGHMTLFHSEKGTSGCENFDKSSQPKNSLKRDITRHKEEKKSPLEDKILSRKRSLEGQITLKHSEKEILDGENCEKISQAENCLESDITVHKEEKKSPTEEKSLSCKSSLKDQITLKHSEQKTLDSGNCKKNLQPGDCLKTDTTNHKEEKTSPLEKSTKISGETSCLKSKETKFQSKTLKCNFCEKTFSRESSLKCHITLTHSEEKTLNSKNSDISPLSESCSKPVIKSETKISHSENHNISSPPKKSLKNHVSTLTEEKTLPNCDKIVENSLEKHLEENLIQVDDINKISPSKSHLKKQRTLTAENSLLIGNRSQRERCLKKEVKVCKKETFVQCEICGKTISSKSIKPHLMIHRGERPFQCEHCKKCFTRKPHLEEHIRMHTGERPFKCDFCERTFLRDAAMRVHLRIHTGVKPFQCTLCEYSFAQKTSLDKHLMTHTKEKPFKCEHCLKGFSRKPHLIDHIRIHTGDKPFKCDTCGRTFTTMTTLYTHVRIHTGEKPYQCEFCDRSFSQMNSWRYHVRCIHTGDKVFQCEICDEKFTRKLLLNKHIAIRHENDESKKPKQ